MTRCARRGRLLAEFAEPSKRGVHSHSFVGNLFVFSLVIVTQNRVFAGISSLLRRRLLPIDSAGRSSAGQTGKPIYFDVRSRNPFAIRGLRAGLNVPTQK